MNRLGRVVHKRAFVKLGHNSLHPACLGVGHNGMVQCPSVVEGTMPGAYGHVRSRLAEQHVNVWLAWDRYVPGARLSMLDRDNCDRSYSRYRMALW